MLCIVKLPDLVGLQSIGNEGAFYDIQIVLNGRKRGAHSLNLILREGHKKKLYELKELMLVTNHFVALLPATS